MTLGIISDPLFPIVVPQWPDNSITGVAVDTDSAGNYFHVVVKRALPDKDGHCLVKRAMNPAYDAEFMEDYVAGKVASLLPVSKGRVLYFLRSARREREYQKRLQQPGVKVFGAYRP